MEQDSIVGRCYLGRRYLRECRLYRVVGIYSPLGYNAQYRCDSLEYSGENNVSMEHHLIDVQEAGDIFMHEITLEQYQRGIEMLHKSLTKIRQHITSLQGIPCDQIQVGNAYRLFDSLYFNLKQNPLQGYTESENLKISPWSITISRTWIPSSLIECNPIGYEKIDAVEVQKAIKQFEFLYATVRNYINALVKEE